MSKHIPTCTFEWLSLSTVNPSHKNTWMIFVERNKQQKRRYKAKEDLCYDDWWGGKWRRQRNIHPVGNLGLTCKGREGNRSRGCWHGDLSALLQFDREFKHILFCDLEICLQASDIVAVYLFASFYSFLSKFPRVLSSFYDGFICHSFYILHAKY